LKGEAKAAPVLRSVPRLGRGRLLPAYFVSSGLGSNVSTCDGPPFMNRWMTRLAFAGSGGFLGVSGLSGEPAGSAASRPDSPRSDARARPPMPMPERARKSRRERGKVIDALQLSKSLEELRHLARESWQHI